MTAVAEILKTKPCRGVHTFDPTVSGIVALRLWADKGFGALLVL
jgi:hypothetical protein